jgi:hypothetical protein
MLPRANNNIVQLMINLQHVPLHTQDRGEKSLLLLYSTTMVLLSPRQVKSKTFYSAVEFCATLYFPACPANQKRFLHAGASREATLAKSNCVPTSVAGPPIGLQKYAFVDVAIFI